MGSKTKRFTCNEDFTCEEDTALNQTCTIIIGCKKSTLLDKLQRIAGMKAPHIQRSLAEYIVRFKQTFDRTRGATNVKTQVIFSTVDIHRTHTGIHLD